MRVRLCVQSFKRILPGSKQRKMMDVNGSVLKQSLTAGSLEKVCYCSDGSIL